MSINFGSVADQVGSAFNKAKNAAEDIFADQAALANELIPRQLVLSSRVNLVFSNMNNEQTLVAIGDIDSFSSQLMIENVKRFKPFGFQFQRTIQKISGWKLSFDAKLDGFEIQYIMNAIQDMIQGSVEGSDPTSLIGFKSIPSVGNSPMFTLIETYKFKDHSEISFAYERFMFDDFNYRIPDDNQPIDVTISGFAQRRQILDIDVNDISVLNKIDKDIIDAMNIINRQGIK